MTIEVGQQVPGFTLTNQHGEQVSLSDYRGGKSVALVFYPFAFSGICTNEMLALRDRLPDFENDRVQLLAISCDPMFTLRAFGDAEGLTFPLLSDFWPHGAVASSYGIFDEAKGCARRGTYIVDPEGVLRWKIENDLPDARDVEEYTAAIASL